TRPRPAGALFRGFYRAGLHGRGQGVGPGGAQNRDGGRARSGTAGCLRIRSPHVSRRRRGVDRRDNSTGVQLAAQDWGRSAESWRQYACVRAVLTSCTSRPELRRGVEIMVDSKISIQKHDKDVYYGQLDAAASAAVGPGEWTRRQKVAIACRIVAADGQGGGIAGQVSARLDDSTFWTQT